MIDPEIDASICKIAEPITLDKFRFTAEFTGEFKIRPIDLTFAIQKLIRLA